MLAVGLLEVKSIATGYAAEDAMLKAAGVRILRASSICSGKFLVLITGDVASVQESIAAGRAAAGDQLIVARAMASLDPAVLAALGKGTQIDPAEHRSIGILETRSAASVIEAADAAIKSAHITILRIQLAQAMGGKGVVIFTGDIANVTAAVSAGRAVAEREGMLIGAGTIAAPSPELFLDCR